MVNAFIVNLPSFGSDMVTLRQRLPLFPSIAISHSSPPDPSTVSLLLRFRERVKLRGIYSNVWNCSFRPIERSLKFLAFHSGLAL